MMSKYGKDTVGARYRYGRDTRNIRNMIRYIAHLEVSVYHSCKGSHAIWGILGFAQMYGTWVSASSLGPSEWGCVWIDHRMGQVRVGCTRGFSMLRDSLISSCYLFYLNLVSKEIPGCFSCKKFAPSPELCRLFPKGIYWMNDGD